MKKIISLLLVCVLLVGCVFTLASCGALSGEYKESITGNIVYKFSGNSFTMTIDNIIGDDTVVEGTYEVNEDEGKITFTTTNEDGEKKTSTESFVKGTEGDVEYIKIGIVKYNKVK